MWWAPLLNNIIATLDAGAGGGAGSFESIATATGTGSSGTITFSGIPSTYASLQLRLITRGTNASATSDLNMRINGVTSSASYKSHYLYGNGSAAGAGADGGSGTDSIFIGLSPAASASSSIMGVGVLDILDYASSSKNKTIRLIYGHDVNGATGYVWLASGMNLSTTAISSLTIYLNAGNFNTDTKIALYGIKGA